MKLSPYAKREEILFIAIPFLLVAIIFIWSKPFSVADYVFMTLLLLFGFFSAYFFRHPKRRIEPDETILYSPADGKITDIEILDEYNDFIQESCQRISMFLSVFNVHINRNPCEGKVAYQRYKKGKYINAMSKKAAKINEYNEVGITNVPHFEKCVVKQISGAVARRIVSKLEPEDAVQQGHPFGMIKFGSRTDLLFPQKNNYSILVKKGDKVKGGITPLVKFHS